MLLAQLCLFGLGGLGELKRFEFVGVGYPDAAAKDKGLYRSEGKDYVMKDGDIVETGTTLRENNLEVLETIVPISARLIANKANYKFKSAQIENIVKELDKIINKEN